MARSRRSNTEKSQAIMDALEDASPAESARQEAQDYAMRPKSMAEFVGQRDAKISLNVAISAAKSRNELPDHILFYGPPGLGKTTLAEIVALEMGANFRRTSAPSISKAGDLAGILTSLEPGSVLFIDEIHGLKKESAELLYTAMEDFAFNVSIGEGVNSQNIRIDLSPFTLIGATTKPGVLLGPLIDRFGIEVKLDYYDTDELLQIIERDASILGLNYEAGALTPLAARSRGTARIAKKLLRRVRDWCQVNFDGVIDGRGIADCLVHVGIDEFGLDRQDKAYLSYLIHTMRCRPVGVGTIAAALSEEVATIESMIEPYLLKIGMIQRTERGRVPTQDAIDKYAASGLSAA